jgi:hypothetical protein
MVREASMRAVPIRIAAAAFVLIIIRWGIAPEHARGGVMLPVFGPASSATELNTPDVDVPNWISPDGLRIVKHTIAGGVGTLSGASRVATNGAFSAPSGAEFVNVNLPLHDVRSAVISNDGLELFYSDTSPTARIFRSTRASTAMPFSSGTFVTGLNTTGDHTYPRYLSPDGLRLYFFRSLSDDVFVATRASVGAAFGAPSATPFINTPNVHQFTLTADERQMYFGFGTRMFWTSRADVSTPFDAPQEITSLAGFNLGAPVTFGDTLFYYRDDDIYTARLVPEPAGMLWAGAAGLLWAARRGRPAAA